MSHHEPSDRSPATAELLDDAFVAPVGVETAARHLWAIHTEANRQAAVAAAARVVQPEPVSLASRRIPRAAVPVLALVMMMSSSGMALAASQSSLPGDVLYPVKRGTEQAQLIFARSPDARTQLQLSFARTRVEEIRQIAGTRPQHVPELVAAINVTLTQVREAAPDDSERVRRELDEEIASLELTSTSQAMQSASEQTSTTTTEATATTETTATDLPSTSAASTTSPTASPSVTPTLGELTTEDPVAALPSTTSGDDDGTDGGATASPTPSSSPTTTTSPTTTSSPTSGTVVGSRPHGDSEGPDGTSRTEDPIIEPAPEPSESPDDPQAEPTEEPTGETPNHYQRPDS